MKKAMKKIIPILLSLLILSSVFWYCFVYDREFTRDVLLQQARFHATRGVPAISSWFYNLAYEHSGQDETVAIELANQFKAIGNYTKAEVTLSQAIADGGSAPLYIALCQTYVEQDKLLDAVTMLDTIANPEIKAQIDAQRPSVPAVSPEPGFYSEYIPVTLSCPEGVVYYTTGNEYPSTGDAPYTTPFTLSIGETVVRAISVGRNGLVSPLSTMKFTVGGVIEEVNFSDGILESAVRNLIGMDAEKTLYTNDLWGITEFTVPEGVLNLQELTYLPYLETLNITNYTFDSIQFLSELTHLKTLNMAGCRFPAEEIRVIASLPDLTELTLAGCGISTVAGLENAQNLISVNLQNNTIRNLEPLSSISRLKKVNLRQNALVSLNALASLQNLEELDVSYNTLTTLSPISACQKLNTLNAASNELTSLEGLNSLTGLKYLTVDHNQLTQIRELAECTNLIELNIANNSITEIDFLSGLNKLEVFNFAYNQVETIPVWSSEGNLRTIDGSHNQIKSISTLNVLTHLTHIYMDYNSITNIEPLASCYSLVMINVYGNEITGAEALTDHDIIVNYDPT